MANDESLMSQDEIERLFSQPQSAAAPAKRTPAAPLRSDGKDDQTLRRTSWKNC